MNKTKAFFAWCLGTWVGSLTLALALAAVVLLPIYGLRHGAATKDHDHSSDLPEDAAYHHMNADGISELWHLLQPATVGVPAWSVGDFSRYFFRDERIDDSREVQFTIVTGLESDHAVSKVFEIDPEGQFWLQVSGFRGFRDIHKDLFQLVTRQDMRVTSSDLSFQVQTDYFPLHHTIYDPYPVPPFAKLTLLGQETLATAVGELACDHYRMDVGSAHLDIWTNPTVSPLGLVRAKNDFQILELQTFGTGMKTTIPDMIQPLLDGRSTLRKGCASCHQSYHECHISVFPPI